MDSGPVLRRAARGGGRRVKKRKRAAFVQARAQEIAVANRDDFEEDSSGSESDEWYEGDEHCEYAFNEGGYYKTKPGDVLNQRYQIRKRMGWGHFSQVYLANDKDSDEHVALKILKTGEDYVQAGEEERSYHEAINKSIENSEGSNICRMLDSFDVYSNRGKHISMVFERMSLSIYELLNFSEEEPGFPLGVVKAITKEVLQGLTELHAANLVHTDLKPENLMLSSIEPVNLEECERYKALYEFREMQKDLELCEEKLEKGGLNKNKKKRVKQRIAKLTAKIDENQDVVREEDNQEDSENETMKKALQFLGNSVLEEGKANVKIVDLGTACFATDKNDYEIGTRNYRGPECILGIRFTQAIDIWAVACMVVELLDGEVLFDPDEEDEEEEFDNEMRNSVHLKQIMEALGKIPKHMINREYFNRKNELLLVGEVEHKGLREILQDKVPRLDDEEDLDNLIEFLKPMLEIDPKKRPTAAQMLEHEWLKPGKGDDGDIKMWLEDILYEEEDDEDEEEDGETPV